MECIALMTAFYAGGFAATLALSLYYTWELEEAHGLLKEYSRFAKVCGSFIAAMLWPAIAMALAAAPWRHAARGSR